MLINPSDNDDTHTTSAPSTQHSVNVLRPYEAPQLYKLSAMPIGGGNYLSFRENSSGGAFRTNS